MSKPLHLVTLWIFVNLGQVPSAPLSPPLLSGAEKLFTNQGRCRAANWDRRIWKKLFCLLSFITFVIYKSNSAAIDQMRHSAPPRHLEPYPLTGSDSLRSSLAWSSPYGTCRGAFARHVYYLIATVWPRLITQLQSYAMSRTDISVDTHPLRDVSYLLSVVYGGIKV